MNADTQEKLNKLIKHVLHTEFDNFIDFMCNSMDHWSNCFDHIYFIAYFTHFTRKGKSEKEIFNLLAQDILNHYDFVCGDQVDVQAENYQFIGDYVGFVCNENEFYLKIEDQESAVHCIDYNPLKINN